MMKHLKDARGFTLFEVIASLVIITIVLISFSQLFVQSNKTVHYNNEKLVLINLAHAELERFKLNPIKNTAAETEKINKPPETSAKCPKKISDLVKIEANSSTMFHRFS